MFYSLARPVLFSLDPECAHDLALWGMRNLGGWMPSVCNQEGEAVEVMGLRFPNRVGLAAGLDIAPDSAWESLREWSQRAGLGNLRELGVPREALEPARALLDPRDKAAVRLFVGDGVQHPGAIAAPGQAHAQIGVLGDVPGVPAADLLQQVAAKEQRRDRKSVV